MTVAELRSRLRAVDPARASLQSALIAALNHRSAADLVFLVEIAADEEARVAAAWIEFAARDARVWIAPVLVDGGIARVSTAAGPDAAGAAASLGPIEPIVAALELAIGCELFPIELAPHCPAESVIVRIEARRATGAVAHRLLLAAPPGLLLAPLAPMKLPAAALAPVPLRWTATLPAPPIPTAALARLGRGDLLLLGTGALIARLSLPGLRDRRARVDLHQGSLVLEENIGQADAAAAPAAADVADLRVPTMVELAGGMITAGEIATLAPGSLLPVDAPGGVLAVRVLAGGAYVADGELVAVGDGFGVLIGAVTGNKGA